MAGSKNRSRNSPSAPPRAICYLLFAVRRASGESRSGEIEAVEVHHLGPRSDKVLHELLLGIAAAVDFGKSPELGVRSKDEVNYGGRPLQVAGAAVASFPKRLRLKTSATSCAYRAG